MTQTPTSRANPNPRAPSDESEFRAWLDGLAAHRSPRGAEGLEIAQQFFSFLGDPQNRVRSIHIVGTAGKGTVAHLATHRLTSAGMSVATHMSPHVHDPRERFLIDGLLPAWPVVLSVVPEVIDAIEKTRLETGHPPSYFAVTAALSCVLGRILESEILILEAGIGGRFDATNVIDHPDRVVVVTAIGLDHTDVLGETVAEIATEKAAVIAGAATVILAPQHEPVAASIVADEAKRARVPLLTVDIGSGSDWRLQADAVAAAVEKAVTGREVRPPTIPDTLPPGRLEALEAAGRRVVLDGAHSAIKLGGLADSLRRSDSGPADCVVAALGRSKDLELCAEVIAGMAPLVIASEFKAESVGSGPHPWSADELAEAVRRQSPTVEVIVVRDATEAADQAWLHTSEGDTIVVTGSFLHLSRMANAMRERGESGSR